MTDTTTTPPAAVTTLTPEQAGARLAEMARGPQPSATPTTAQEAAARLRVITKDSKWSERFLSGNSPEVREFNDLSALIASGGDEAAGISDIITTVNALEDQQAVSPVAYEGLIGGLRSQGLPDEAEQAIRDIDAGVRTDRPSQGDGAACRQVLDRLIKNPEWRQRVLAGDVRANNLKNALDRVIAYAGNDGQPASDWLRQKLSELGLR
jgi:hypothetical protein